MFHRFHRSVPRPATKTKSVWDPSLRSCHSPLRASVVGLQRRSSPVQVGPDLSQRLMRTTELGTCDIETCGTTGELEALPPAREASGMRCSWVTLGGSRDDNLKCRPSSRGICIRRNLDVGWLWTAHPDSGQIIQIREWSQIRVACALHPSDLNPIQHRTTSYTYCYDLLYVL